MAFFLKKLNIQFSRNVQLAPPIIIGAVGA
jgi:hypothetical protein